MEHLIYENYGRIALLKINRPKVLNALNHAVLTELLEFLTKTAIHEKLQGLIVTGSGDRAFIAGADIKEMQLMDHVHMFRFCELGQAVSNALENAPYLTIAAVNGYALGGGLEMALACDFIYASSTAKLGLPEVTLGLIPGFGGTQRLARIVGKNLAKELIMSGRTFTAQEAKEYGIVNRVCEDEALISECRSIADSIACHSPTATMQAKNAINRGYNLSLPEALELEKNMCAVCFATPERAEAMAFFMTKNKG